MEKLNNTTHPKAYLNFNEVTKPFLETEFVIKKVMCDYNARISQGKPANKLESLFYWIDAKVKYCKDDLEFKKANKFARTAKQIWESGLTTGCTDYAILFATFAKQLGIPTTILHTAELDWINALQTCGDFKMHNGHNFNECFYDNKWVLVDPTYCKLVEKYNPDNIELSYNVGGKNKFVAFNRTSNFEPTNIKEYNKQMDITCYKLELSAIKN